MTTPIERYAVIGDCRSAGLISDEGSLDWLCLPRFDSPSMFGALLGGAEQGSWGLRPADATMTASRRYDTDTFTLVTRWVSADGSAEVEVLDCMPVADGRNDVVRRVRGIRGTVRMRQDLRLRFDYAASVPWVRQVGTGEEPALLAVAGPDAVIVRGPQLEARDRSHVVEFEVEAGATFDAQLSWFPAHRDVPSPLDVDAALRTTSTWWREWARACTEPGAHDAAVRRSLLALRLLTHEDTGGIVAAATMSLPEEVGGERNWDYRFVWLRDAALTLEAFMRHGYTDEARAWRGWLLRAIAGDAADIQIMYGIGGERRLPEWVVATLPGYGGSAPVRVGNAASAQFQGDIFGEVLIALDAARHAGLAESTVSWSLQTALLAEAARNIGRADSGIWEIRGSERRFTHSLVMLWAAFDRGVCAVEWDGLHGPVEQWRALRDRLAVEIEEACFDPGLGSYVQYAGSTEVDAALLRLAQVGYVEYDDPRMLGTVARIEQTLMPRGLVRRYRTETDVDGVAGDEGAFVACSFWLVEQYARSGRLDDAAALMDRLLALCNDVGLLSEEVDLVTGAHLGNTPQALSHLALVRAADAIARVQGIAAHAHPATGLPRGARG